MWDDGSVCVGGVDVRQYDMEALRNQVSVVLQKNTLFSGTILDNLRWGNPDATEEECIAACQAACADEFIDRMLDGYHTHIERGGANVSGGQKQRLCIARALLKQPKVLFWTTRPARSIPRPTPRSARRLPSASRVRPRSSLRSAFRVSRRGPHPCARRGPHQRL